MADRAPAARRGRSSALWPVLALPGILWLLAAVPRAALRRAGDRLRPGRPGLPDAGAGVEPAAVEQLAVPRRLPAHRRQRRLLRPGPAAHRRLRAGRELRCLLVAYPVAYYTARLAGGTARLLLALLIAPFWISYMMRMLAWVNLLQNDGLVNRLIGLGGVLPNDIDWLDGRAIGRGDRARLRLRAVHDPAAVRRTRPAAAQRAGGGPRPRGRPVRDVPPGDPAAEPAGDRRGRAPHLPPDARRLLHRRPAVGLAAARPWSATSSTTPCSPPARPGRAEPSCCSS